jgi:peptidoglycan/LPS O-acetylase OafA/YrhL
MKNKRYYILDTVRGLAALFVVLFHYHHFYLRDNNDRENIPDTELFPYSNIFDVFYVHGHLAVQLFWCISGFVFYHVYLNHRVGLINFISHRIARLYPLHLFTLFLVAGIQLLSINYLNHWQIYGNNDIFHFVLQLFFASNWTTKAYGLSFNGPIWSVSLEVVTYGLFFIMLPMIRNRPLSITFLALLLNLLILCNNVDTYFLSKGVFNCASFFFVGGLAYTVLTTQKTKYYNIIIIILIAIIISAGYVISRQFSSLLISCFFIVYICVLLERYSKYIPRQLIYIGDISYSIYLVHVPLQMLVLFVDDSSFGATREFANHFITMPIYIICTLIFSSLSYRYIEIPSRDYIKRISLKMEPKVSGT